MAAQDEWARWLLERRFGGDAEQQQAMLAQLYPIRDRVLGHARVAAGDALLDVGAGDGLIAFGALPLVGASGLVIVSDVSQELLEVARALAEATGALDRCRFLRAAAEDLSALADASVNVVTTRSVLIYVAEKRQALREFYRVLKPGGRLSLFEPINRFGYPEPPGRLFGYDVTPVQTIAEQVQAVYQRAQPADTDPMLNFDERDLLAAAEAAGFGELHLTYEATIAPNPLPLRWEAFQRTAFNPKAPTLAEAMQAALSASEAEELTAYLQPLVDAEPAPFRLGYAYLWAIKR